METDLIMLMFLSVTIVLVAYALEKKTDRPRNRQGDDRHDGARGIRARRDLRRRRASRLFGEDGKGARQPASSKKGTKKPPGQGPLSADRKPMI